ncbi:MAG: TIGR04141 family sporadically distributed protein [Pseudomonadota bacterium]
MCFTFGHARHLIAPLAIERYFGLKVALSMSDPELIRSIDKTNIDKTPFRSSAQSSKYVSISEFEFKSDWEILKSLTGVVASDDLDDYELVSGTDSVSLYTDVTLARLPRIADRLLAAYADDAYKTKYPWIDYIVPIRDKSVRALLDQVAIDKVNRREFDDTWIAPPAMVPYANFGGFCYRKVRTRDGNTQPVSLDLDLESCLTVKGLLDSLTVAKSKSSQIRLFDANDQEIESWSIYLCLNVEAEHEGRKYLLNEGTWYAIDRNFVADIEAYFEEFDRSTLPLPPYGGRHEPAYLIHASESGDFLLMDQKFVRLSGASSSFEFCDLLTRDNHIVHVKKYSSSSVLSHLFSQAFVSAESLARSAEVVEQVNSHLRPDTDHTFVFDSQTQPRPATIVLGIMQKRAGDLHMPFFSKVNFKQYSQRLIDMGYKVALQKIPL